jgi:hypothetical protein
MALLMMLPLGSDDGDAKAEWRFHCAVCGNSLLMVAP